MILAPTTPVATIESVVSEHAPTFERTVPSPHRRGFTLLELIVVVVVLGVLALVAVPSFRGVIGETAAETARETADSVATAANALAAFNDGSSTNQTDFTNIQEATLEADLQPSAGWAFEINSGLESAWVALEKNGSVSCWSISVDATLSPDRAVVNELFNEQVASAEPCPGS